MKCENLYALTFTQLAGRLGEDRNSIARALAEPDAPQKRKRGWVVSEVGTWMFIRRLEKMSDPDFEAMCHSVEGEDMTPGERMQLEAIRRGGRSAYINELRGEA